MKLKYYGTAAAEGIPAFFCRCAICEHAHHVGGREVRTRSQSVIDDVLMIDFPPDAYMHMVVNGLRYDLIQNLIFTHAHGDHFNVNDLAMRLPGFSNGYEVPLSVYSNQAMATAMADVFKGLNPNYQNSLQLHVFEPYRTVVVGAYDIIPLRANHGRDLACFIFQITKGDKTLLYGHDSGVFSAEIWDFWAQTKPYFDLVSLDCTLMAYDIRDGHMGFNQNVEIKDMMISKGYADEKTCFVASHFSHNGGVSHEEFEEQCRAVGIVVAYDGLVIRV